MKRRYFVSVAVLGLTLGLAACGSSSGSSATSSPTGTGSSSSAAATGPLPTSAATYPAGTGSLTIGSADFAENQILAYIYGNALAARGVKITYKPNIGERAQY